jgi:hypothetical protein
LANLGFEPAMIPLAETRDRIRSDGAKWARVIRDAGIKAE